MAQAIVNLAVPVIQEKVDEALKTYPAVPQGQVFSSIALREKLVAYVLSRMPALYTTVEESEACSVEQPANCFSGEQQAQMELLIHKGIQHLTTQQQTWETSIYLPTTVNDLSPSSWFG